MTTHPRIAVSPNLAWAPTTADPARPAVKGMQVQVPSTRRVSAIKQMVMPVKGEGVFVAPNANVLGDVKIGAGSSIWYGATLRGERATSRQLGPGKWGQKHASIRTRRRRRVGTHSAWSARLHARWTPMQPQSGATAGRR